jgi:catechol 2,3-dioxygenase-like lactoylglutathione lyase family enzyme
MRTQCQHIGHVTLLVREYEEAKVYSFQAFGFDLIEDRPLPDGKRWVLAAPRGSDGRCLLLAKAATRPQAEKVGDQTGGRVFPFLPTNDLWRDLQSM